MIGVEHVSIVKQKAETPCLSMRPKQAAKALGISERLLWEWTRRGIVPHVKIGGVVVYPTDALREWLRQRVDTVADDGKKSSGIPE